MATIETRILSRLLVSFSRPDSADGENLSATEVQTLVDIMHEFAQIHPMVVRLFESTAKIAHKLEADSKYHLTETEQKTVLAFWSCVDKSLAFHKGEDKNLDFVSLQGLDGVV